jgi:hypothetical protein
MSHPLLGPLQPVQGAIEPVHGAPQSFQGGVEPVQGLDRLVHRANQPFHGVTESFRGENCSLRFQNEAESCKIGAKLGGDSPWGKKDTGKLASLPHPRSVPASRSCPFAIDTK